MLRVVLIGDMHFPAWVMPDNLIAEVVFPKYLIHYDLEVMHFLPVQMNVDGPIVRQ